MIFNTLIKGGGITGKPIEVTELPTPTASDVDKIYLLKEENTTYLSPQVGQPFGNKIYFNTELNPLDYTSNFQGGTDLLRTETTDEYYSLAFVDILALQGVEGYGHAYIIGVANGALSTVIGISYVYCDVLSVDQFNAMVGSQFGISITEFGWLASEIDTSSIADRIVNTNILPAYDNIAYTSTESTFKEEYYKCVEIKDTIEVGKPVPNILYFDTSKTPEFSGVPVDDTNGRSYFTTQDGWFGLTAISHSDEATGNQGTFEMLAFMFNNNQLPVPLYFGGTASIDVINAMFSDLGMTFTEKGWQVEGTFNITERAIEVATNLGIAQDEFMPQLELAFADPVVTFNDPQGLFLFPTTYNFQPLGKSGFPIEVEELPTPTEDDIDKVYLNTTTDEYYVAIDELLLSDKIRYNVGIIPSIATETNIRYIEIDNVKLAYDDGSYTSISFSITGACGSVDDGTVIIIVYLLHGNVFPLYVGGTGSLEKIQEFVSQLGFTVTEKGWVGDGILDITQIVTDYFAERDLTDAERNRLIEGFVSAPIITYDDPQGIFTIEPYVYFELINKKGIDDTEKLLIADRSGSYNIPNTVTEIGRGAFCAWNSESFEIPSHITKIGEYAFLGAQLTSIVIPDSVTYIGHSAFYECVNLTEIEIPDNTVSSVASDTFYYCRSLTSVVIGNGVTYIGNEAFGACFSLISVVIGGSLTAIGMSAFNGCSSCLTYDFSNHTNVPALGSGAFNGINANAKIIVPDALYDTWIARTDWLNLASYIIRKSEYTGG